MTIGWMKEVVSIYRWSFDIAYYLPFFVILTSVANRIEKLQRDFLWVKNPSCTRWKTVCTLMTNGGLGIRRALSFNKSLLGKWLWQF